MFKLNKVQKLGFMGSFFCAMVLLFLHNPFGGYDTERWIWDKWIPIESIWDYVSMNSLVSWMETPLEFFGFLIPVVIFGAVWIYLFKD